MIINVLMFISGFYLLVVNYFLNHASNWKSIVFLKMVPACIGWLLIIVSIKNLGWV